MTGCSGQRNASLIDVRAYRDALSRVAKAVWYTRVVAWRPRPCLDKGHMTRDVAHAYAPAALTLDLLGAGGQSPDIEPAKAAPTILL